jgi:hypothetical protein
VVRTQPLVYLLATWLSHGQMAAHKLPISSIDLRQKVLLRARTGRCSGKERRPVFPGLRL